MVKDLKHNKWFNIKNKDIRSKVFNVVETGIVDPNTGMYMDKEANELVKQIDNVLPNLNWLMLGKGEMFNPPDYNEVKDILKSEVIDILKEQGLLKK